MKTPCCKTLHQWLRDNCGKQCLAPLTGTDSAALDAAVHTAELYAYEPCEQVALAFGFIVLQMQPKCRWLAYHAIAHVMDWSDRERIWQQARLEPVIHGTCFHEPEEHLTR